jgi:hypothetical protein
MQRRTGLVSTISPMELKRMTKTFNFFIYIGKNSAIEGTFFMKMIQQYSVSLVKPEKPLILPDALDRYPHPSLSGTF